MEFMQQSAKSENTDVNNTDLTAVSATNMESNRELAQFLHTALCVQSVTLLQNTLVICVSSGKRAKTGYLDVAL